MNQNLIEELFSDSFDTFKVFNNLTAQETGCNLPLAPKTIWQILNHLLVWQDYQLTRLQDFGKEIEIDEQLTWNEEEQCDNQERLDEAVAAFNNQLNSIRVETAKFNLEDLDLPGKLKIVQDLSVHLAFHIGEVILMRRIAGNYPLPHQMKEFLNEL